MRPGRFLISLLSTGCFAGPPSVEDDGDSSDGSGTTLADASDEGAPIDCMPMPAPEGCIDPLSNGGLDDWNEALPMPASWLVTLGSGTRAEGEAGPCTPALELTAGEARDDGVVWEFGQDFVDIEIPAGGRATFLARIELVEGELGDLRICYEADPASICEKVVGFVEGQWVTVMAETVAIDGAITLKDFGLTGNAPGQVVRVDDMRLFTCAS
jgi:hypothetical protein